MSDPLKNPFAAPTIDEQIATYTAEEAYLKKNAAKLKSEDNTFFKNTRDVFTLTNSQAAKNKIAKADIDPELKTTLSNGIDKGLFDTNMSFDDSQFEAEIQNDDTFDSTPYLRSETEPENISKFLGKNIDPAKFEVLPNAEKKSLIDKANAIRLVQLDQAYGKHKLNMFKQTEDYKENPIAIDSYKPSRAFVKVNGDLKVVDVKSLEDNIKKITEEIASDTNKKNNVLKRRGVASGFQQTQDPFVEKENAELFDKIQENTIKLKSLNDLHSKVLDKDGNVKEKIYNYNVDYGFTKNTAETVLYNATDFLFGYGANKSLSKKAITAGKALSKLNIIGLTGQGLGLITSLATGKDIPEHLFGRDGKITELKGFNDTTFLNNAVESGASINDPTNITPNTQEELTKARNNVANGLPVVNEPTAFDSGIKETENNLDTWGKIGYGIGRGLPESFEYMQGFKLTSKVANPIKDALLDRVSKTIFKVSDSLTGNPEKIIIAAGKVGNDITGIEKLAMTFEKSVYNKQLSGFQTAVNEGKLTYDEAFNTLQTSVQESKIVKHKKLFDLLHSASDKVLTGVINYQFAAAYNNLRNINDKNAQIDLTVEPIGGVVEELVGGAIGHTLKGVLRKMPFATKLGKTRAKGLLPHFIANTVEETFQEYAGDAARQIASGEGTENLDMLTYFSTMMPMTLTSGLFHSRGLNTHVKKVTEAIQEGHIKQHEFYTAPDGTIKSRQKVYTKDEAVELAKQSYYRDSEYLTKEAYREQLELYNTLIDATKYAPDEPIQEDNMSYEEGLAQEDQKTFDTFATEQNAIQQNEKNLLQVDRNVKIALDKAGIISLPKVQTIDPKEIVKYKGKSGYIVQDGDTKEYIFVDKSNGEETILVGGGNEQSQKELGIDKTNEKPKATDYVQWVINGHEQFLEPQVITDIQEKDGVELAKIGDSQTYVPLNQLEIKPPKKSVEVPVQNSEISSKTDSGEKIFENPTTNKGKGKKEPISKAEPIKKGSKKSPANVNSKDFQDDMFDSIIAKDEAKQQEKILTPIALQTVSKSVTTEQATINKAPAKTVGQIDKETNTKPNTNDKSFVGYLSNEQPKTKMKIGSDGSPTETVDIAKDVIIKDKKTGLLYKITDAQSDYGDYLSASEDGGEAGAGTSYSADPIKEQKSSIFDDYDNRDPLFNISTRDLFTNFDIVGKISKTQQTNVTPQNIEVSNGKNDKTQEKEKSQMLENNKEQPTTAPVVAESPLQVHYTEIENVYNTLSEKDDVTIDTYKEEFNKLIKDGFTEDESKETIIEMMLCK
jgi:hypothetical protein